MLKSLSCGQTTDKGNSERRFNKHAIYFIPPAFLPLSGEKRAVGELHEAELCMYYTVKD